MRVTHVDSKVTNFTLGGEEAVDFSISNSPEFYKILSSNLYTDQKLAVVRETLCNAWDAHIEQGITDIPIEITLDDNSLTVKDYGKGIPHKNIKEIYCVYGNSTKKNDGTQTGGFGLGCKAPFAYTDTFDVISSNNGTQTLYSFSSNNPDTDGKPSYITVVQTSTYESGISVIIPIKHKNDVKIFEQKILQVAYEGDINIVLNGEKCETMGFDTSISNFCITQDPR